MRVEFQPARIRRQAVRLEHAADHLGDIERRELQLGARIGRPVVGQEILHQLLQAQAVRAQDAGDFALRGAQRAGAAVGEQLGALAYRGERRLQLVRDVREELGFLLLQLGEAQAQPFEPLAERLDVARPLHADRGAEVRHAEPPHRGVEVAHRARGQPGEGEGEPGRERQRRGEQHAEDALRAGGARIEIFDLAVNQDDRLVDDVLGEVRELHEIGDHGDRVERTARRPGKRLPQRLLALDRAVELVHLDLVERQQRELAGGRLEPGAQAPIGAEQRRVAEHQVLAHAALHRGDLLGELAAGACRERRLVERVTALPGELLQGPSGARQRDQQRQGGDGDSGECKCVERPWIAAHADPSAAATS